MTRPHHSLGGFRRYMQMSRTRVFVLVEGRRVDRFFYSELLGPICRASGLKFEIVLANRFAECGGKRGLLSLHEFLRAGSSLVLSSQTGTSLCIFYMDKDVDDVLGRLVKSRHIVYTPFYTVENLLFAHGDVIRASAAASSLPTEAIGQRIPDSGIWRRARAELWKDFVALCLFSQKNRVNFSCNYGRSTSLLNDPPEAPTNINELNARKDELRELLGLSQGDCERKTRAAFRLVERAYRKGWHELVFNGKWYVGLLAREIELAANGEGYNRQSLPDKLLAALAMSVDFNGAWADYFKEPLRELIAAEMGAADEPSQ